MIKIRYKKEYFNENWQVHKVNGPAVEYLDGDYTWYYNGQRHRYYGLAKRWSYWIFGREIK